MGRSRAMPPGGRAIRTVGNASSSKSHLALIPSVGYNEERPAMLPGGYRPCPGDLSHCSAGRAQCPFEQKDPSTLRLSEAMRRRLSPLAPFPFPLTRVVVRPPTTRGRNCRTLRPPPEWVLRNCYDLFLFYSLLLLLIMIINNPLI